MLDVRDLQVSFPGRRGTARVVTGLDLAVAPGETVALVGESGSGKSVSMLATIGLLPEAARVSGQVLLDGVDLLSVDDEVRRQARGRQVGMVFQDPMTSLNPVLTIGRQVGEGLELHLGMRGRAVRDRSAELLAAVGIPDPRRRLDDYPHQFSGGMRQRVMIAIALACAPRLLIADEPTTALDVTTQAQILDLVRRLQDETGTAVVWVTHDLGVVAGLADRVVVMYAGQVVEQAPVDDLYAAPRHPYTAGLLGALPVLGEERAELATIPGLPPDPADRPPGCQFWPRCRSRLDPRCATEPPPLREVAPRHLVRSFYEVPRG
ncbi:MAG: ABC transporter ATP-binding protein [Actinomycetota bacterium]|nr:ABC transporter ATP-binding protein [Actinomycetota bacterium]